MNILINTGHPAQIHHFKHLKWELEKKGHKIFWIASDKEISKNLLDNYGISYTLFPRPKKSMLSKTALFIKNTLLAINYLKKNKINLSISRVSPHVSIASFLLGIRHFAFTDTETAKFYDRIFGSLVTELFTADSFKLQLRKRQIRFDGNIELFYLHPNRFKPENRESITKLLGIRKEDLYIIMRFVSWEAYHDKGLIGFSDNNKKLAVNEFSKYARVFISSEKQLPPELEAFRINIPYEKIHDVLFHSSLFFGESATMASESAVLGRPSIYLNENWFGSTDEEQKSGLLFSYKSSPDEQMKAIMKGVELLKEENTDNLFISNHRNFIHSKIDVTAFIVWFIENYPRSKAIMHNSPDYQYNFR